MNLEKYFGSYANPYGFKFLVPIIVLVILWTLVWKGMALWRAARKNDKIWFVVLLLVNTLGVLEILYLYVFGKSKTERLH